MADSASHASSSASAESVTDSGAGDGGGAAPQFQTTRWSMIAHAAEDSSPDQRAALEELCWAYWQPVYAFIRRSGLDPHQAEDLTQDFFADLVDRGPLIETADPAQGRFRTYLLAAVKNRMANFRRDAAVIKRGGNVQTFSMDAATAEQRYAAEPVDGWTPEALFNRRWALTLLENVLDQLQRQYARADRDDWFRAMHPFLTTDDRPPYDELARQLGTTNAATRVAVHRLRKQYRDALAAAIAATLGEGETVAEERMELLQSLSPKR